MATAIKTTKTRLRVFTTECVALAKAEALGNVANSDYIGIKKFHIVCQAGVVEVTPVTHTTIGNKIYRSVVFMAEGRQFASMSAIVKRYKLK